MPELASPRAPARPGVRRSRVSWGRSLCVTPWCPWAWKAAGTRRAPALRMAVQHPKVMGCVLRVCGYFSGTPPPRWTELVSGSPRLARWTQEPAQHCPRPLRSPGSVDRASQSVARAPEVFGLRTELWTRPGSRPGQSFPPGKEVTRFFLVFGCYKASFIKQKETFQPCESPE